MPSELRDSCRLTNARLVKLQWPLLMFLPLSSLAIVGCERSGTAIVQSEPPSTTRPNRNLVVIVHGTWGGESRWSIVVPGKASFGSELARGLGGTTEIYPFLWASSILPEKRVEAANNLTRLLRRRPRSTIESFSSAIVAAATLHYWLSALVRLELTKWSACRPRTCICA